MKMRIEGIIGKLDLQVYAGRDNLLREVSGAYASDLLSDVMGRAKAGNMWITMQTHKNIVAVATLKELAAILIVNGGKPDEDTLTAAASEGIIVLGTAEGAFQTCGRLYEILERNAVV